MADSRPCRRTPRRLSTATPSSPDPLEQVDAYEQWQKSEGVRLVKGFYFEDLNTLELGHWSRKGG